MMKPGRNESSCWIGGPESTFIGIATNENVIVGAYVGDSRAYLFDSEGRYHLITATPSKYCLIKQQGVRSPN